MGGYDARVETYCDVPYWLLQELGVGDDVPSAVEKGIFAHRAGNRNDIVSKEFKNNYKAKSEFLYF